MKKFPRTIIENRAARSRSTAVKPRCPYCTSGRIAVEPGSALTYPCPDCRSVTTAQDTYGGVLVIDPRDCDDRDHVETESEKAT